MLSLDTRITRNGDILHAPVGTEESVMMSVDAGQYYGLNAVARHIWELLEAPRTIAELRDGICIEFEVDPATCEADLLPFVEQWRERDIIRVAAP